MLKSSTKSTHGGSIPSDRITGLGALLICLAGLAWSWSKQSFAAYPEDTDHVFPLLIFSVGILVGLSMLTRQRHGGHSHEDGDQPRQLRIGRAVLMGSGLAAYAGVLSVLGFPLATALFQLFTVGAVFGKRGALWLALVPFATTLILCLAFDRLLNVPLPRGVGPFYYLSSWIV